MTCTVQQLTHSYHIGIDLIEARDLVDQGLIAA
jgi:hypothetical protein